MEYRSLGRSGTMVSRVCVGTMNFGGRTPEPDAHAILDRAADSGVNFVDTANVYGHEPADFEAGRGRSEEIVGRWLRGRRDRFVVATKVFFPMTDEPGALGAGRRNVIRECDASLRRLGTDWIDLYQLHHPSNDIPIDETLRALDDLVTAGKVRHVGTSSFAAWQLVEALWASDRSVTVRMVSEQPVYNLLDRRIERELVPMADTFGIGLLTWSPLAGGLLTGTYQRDRLAPPGTRLAEFWQTDPRSLAPTVFDAVDAITELAAGAEHSVAQLAQSWVLAQPAVTSMIVGPRTVEQLDTSLACTRLEPAVLEALDRIAPPGHCLHPQYGSDGLAWHPWGPHRHRWP
jgi:aryl-alcohol dehydrogenase-like predicted oxidoreductase